MERLEEPTERSRFLDRCNDLTNLVLRLSTKREGENSRTECSDCSRRGSRLGRGSRGLNGKRVYPRNVR